MLKRESSARGPGTHAVSQNDHRTSPLRGNRSVIGHPGLGRGPAKPTPRKKPSKGKSSPRDPKRSVLIVDDVPDVTEVIGLLLKHAGYEVATADSAPAALQLATERVFDVIISDIGMPEMNGYELAASLRQSTRYQSIPIIAVTGYSEYDDRSRAQRAGFNAHLTKPIDPSELLTLLNGLLS